jgi:hypothetical protein
VQQWLVLKWLVLKLDKMLVELHMDIQLYYILFYSYHMLFQTGLLKK